jgi:hypothetical protein
MPKHKVLVPPFSSAPSKELALFSDERWASIKEFIPEVLSVDADARLRTAVMACCSWFLTQNARVQEGQQTAVAIRDPGKRQLAPFKRMAKSLREAADAWKAVGKAVHDDRLSELREYDRLELMAQDAERRLQGFRRLGDPIHVADPWPEFVCRIADSCRKAGLNPTATGRGYDEKNSKPSWFQRFVAALDKNLLGSRNLLGVNGKGEQVERDHRAFYAGIAKAMSGYGKPGKARKQIT